MCMLMWFYARYNNEVPVDKRVFKNVKLFMENKKDGDDLFDRLNTSVLNQYLNGLMDGLTAKVFRYIGLIDTDWHPLFYKVLVVKFFPHFRTFNASHTLQEQLDELTDKVMWSIFSNLIISVEYSKAWKLKQQIMTGGWPFYCRRITWPPRCWATTEPTGLLPFSATIRFFIDFHLHQFRKLKLVYNAACSAKDPRQGDGELGPEAWGEEGGGQSSQEGAQKSKEGSNQLYLVQLYEATWYIIAFVHWNNTSFSLQAAKEGGNQAERDKKEKTVQQWVLPAIDVIVLDLYLLSIFLIPECVRITNISGWRSNRTSLRSR